MTWYEGANRAKRLRTALSARSLDALLALTPENAGYISGHYNYIATHWRTPGLFSAAVNGNGDLAVVTGDFGGDPSVRPLFRHLTFQIWTESIDVRDQSGGSVDQRVRSARPESAGRPAQFDLGEVFDRVAEAVASVAPENGRIGIELAVLPEASFARLRHRLPHVTLIEAGDIFDDLRAIKDDDEITLLRLAGELTEAGIVGAIDRLAFGQSAAAVNSLYQVAVHERVVAEARYDAFRQAEGAASIGMGIDSPGVVAPGQTIKFDMQVDVGGYHSDIGRTVAFEPTKDQQAIYDALRSALEAAQETIRPGVKLAEIHAAGTASMHAAGFTNYSRGHLGHSVGLTQNFEEPPFISADEYRRIVPGMVLSLELPYYVFGVGAFQLERMILVSEDGHKAIDQLPFKLSIEPR